MHALNLSDDTVSASKEPPVGDCAEVFHRHHPELLNFVYRMSGGNRGAAEDVVQQVFLNLWRNRGSFDWTKPIKPLLLTMARNAWLNLAKRESYRKAVPIDDSFEGARDTDAQVNDLQIAVKRAVDALEESVRETFVLSRYHGLKYREIAEALGVSVKTVEARMSRALDELRAKLKEWV